MTRFRHHWVHHVLIYCTYWLYKYLIWLMQLAIICCFECKDNYGGYMVAFAGRKYAARSPPAFIANSTYTVTSFTLVIYHPPTPPWYQII